MTDLTEKARRSIDVVAKMHGAETAGQLEKMATSGRLPVCHRTLHIPPEPSRLPQLDRAFNHWKIHRHDRSFR